MSSSPAPDLVRTACAVASRLARASVLETGPLLGFGVHLPEASWKPSGHEAHAVPEVQVLHVVGHASHTPEVALAQVAFGQKAVHLASEVIRYGLLEVATHEVQLVMFEPAEAGVAHVAHEPSHGLQWLVLLGAKPSGHAA